MTLRDDSDLETLAEERQPVTEGGARQAPVKHRPRMKLSVMHPGSLAALGGVAILTLWQILVSVGFMPRILLPPPSSIASAFFATITESFFYRHLWTTFFEVITGYAIGASVGFVLGIFLGISPLAKRVARPYVVAFQGLPKVVFAPLFVTLFGFGLLPKTLMAAAISFFPILINTEAGMTSVDPEARRLMGSMNASKKDTFFKLLLPHSLSMVFAGLKTGLTLALVGAIVGEFFGASIGLGYLLQLYTYQLQVSRVWAITAVLAIMGVVLFQLVEMIHRKVVFWEFQRT